MKKNIIIVCLLVIIGIMAVSSYSQKQKADEVSQRVEELRHQAEIARMQTEKALNQATEAYKQAEAKIKATKDSIIEVESRNKQKK